MEVKEFYGRGTDYQFNMLEAIGVVTPDRRQRVSSCMCPICEKDTLTVFAEQHNAGIWLYCTDCRFAGEPMELVAAVEQRILAEVVTNACQSTQQANLRDKITGTIKRIEWQQQVRRFWQRAAQVTSHNGVPNGESLMELGHSEVCTFDGHGLMGLANLSAVEDILGELPFKRRRVPRSRRTNRRLIQNDVQEQVWIIAHEDLPGRIVGFTLIRGGVEMESRKVVYHSLGAVDPVTDNQVTGLGMLAALDSPYTTRWGHDVFLISDPRQAIELQSYHLQKYNHPLPLLVLPTPSIGSSLRLPPMVTQRRVIVCGSYEETADLLEGYPVWAIEPSLTNLCLYGAPDLLEKCRRDARPWNAFCDPASHHDPHEMVQAALRFNFRAETQACNTGNLQPQPTTRQSIECAGTVVEESEDGWWAHGANRSEQICSHPLRIIQILNTLQDETHYLVTVDLPERSLTCLFSNSNPNPDGLLGFVATRVSRKRPV